MLLLLVAFCTQIHKHECDLNIEGGEGAKRKGKFLNAFDSLCTVTSPATPYLIFRYIGVFTILPQVSHFYKIA